MLARGYQAHQPVPSHMTAARTGATYDMADLITAGHATKVPRPVMVSTAAKMKVLGQTQETMPGDLMGIAKSNSAIDRICAVVRNRNLDLLNLMDDFLKRPRGSRMPVRNRSFMDVSTFRRALCYAMGDQWTGLAVSTHEFEDLYAPYIRKDVAHESRLGNVQASAHPGVGQPEPLITWQRFAKDVQRLADGTGLDEMQQSLYDAEQAVADESSKAAKAAEAMRDADATFADSKLRMQARQAELEKKMQIPYGNRGCSLGQVEQAKQSELPRRRIRPFRMLVRGAHLRATLTPWLCDSKRCTRT